MIRVALFGGVLALVFAAAAGFGRAVGPLERETPGAHAGGEPAHGEHAADAPSAPAGLALEANGFRFVPQRTRFAAGVRVPFSFGIAGARRFEETHERPMHLIVVRRDLDGFQHVHPTRTADGSWTVPLVLTQPGAYRAFADFTADGKRTVVGVDLFVPGLWRPGRSAERGTGPYAVQLHRHGNELAFRVTRNGRDVAVDPYLGARGHLVVLREGDLAYVHTHAEEDELAFEVPFPSAGRYRAYLQFAVAGTVYTKSFDLEQR